MTVKSFEKVEGLSPPAPFKNGGEQLSLFFLPLYIVIKILSDWTLFLIPSFLLRADRFVFEDEMFCNKFRQNIVAFMKGY